MLEEELKKLIIEVLELEEITPDDIKPMKRFLLMGSGLILLMLWSSEWR